ncbi:hypothetical protein [Asticcacaulis endophyticus]|uniref:Uncharacterized protein n=1 Tax=Asticcacaulis endophyticus TaxID=1395890 RepID=A0A918PSZ9_9CAUL|nr:hypothetical protein [Asticcacaulis endophyticus]GGZ21709.1 hypothetical protein GCM10011273_03110 [Asticcacaulis endophyticus]
MDILDIKQDRAAIDAGDWVDNIPGLPGVRLKVRGTAGDTAENLRDAKLRALGPDAINVDGGVKDEVVERIAREVLHEAILLDWDGIESGGKPLPYSLEAARPLCLDKNFKNFQDKITWAAAKVVRINTGKREALEKN